MTEDLPISLHGGGTALEPRPKRRRRTTRSCLQCRQRKIKCDRNKPCINCTTSERQCTYITPDGHVKETPAIPFQAGDLTDWARSPSRPPLLPRRPRQLQLGLDATPETNGASIGRLSASNAPEQLDPSRNLAGHTHASLPPTVEVEAADTSRDTQIDGESPVHSTDAGKLSDHPSLLGIHDTRVAINKTRLLGSSTSWAMKHEFSEIFGCFMECSGMGNGVLYQSPEAKAIMVQVTALLDQCKSIARRIKIARPTRCNSCLEPAHAMALPSRDVADTMLESYIAHFESTQRIMHIPTFRAEYARYWENPAEAPNSLRFKVLLAVGLGSSVARVAGSSDNTTDCIGHDMRDTEFRKTVQQWTYAAQFWLSGPLEKDRLNISGIQVACLVIMARQIFSLGGDLVWTSMGVVINSAMQIGLHRDPSHLPGPMSVLQAEVRRRLWATILELNLQAALDSGMPPRIGLDGDDYDTQPPGNHNDDELREAVAELTSHPKHVHTSTSLQLLLLDSLRLRTRVLKLLNGLTTDVSYTEVLSLSSSIIDACRAYTHFGGRKEGGSTISPFHRNMLDYHVRRFLLPLHCSFSGQARTNPLFYYSRRVSIDATMAIVSPEPDPGFRRLMVMGGGLFREVFRFAGVAIGNELITQAETQRQDLTLHRSAEYRALLKQTMGRLIALAVERIRHGETNIKTYAFMNMVLAQAEAIEHNDATSEVRIAQSARDSFSYCQELLQEHAGSAASSPWSGNGAADMEMGDLDVLQGGFAAWDFDFGTFQDTWYA